MSTSSATMIMCYKARYILKNIQYCMQHRTTKKSHGMETFAVTTEFSQLK